MIGCYYLDDIMEALSEKFREKLSYYSETELQGLINRLQTLEGVGPVVSEYLEMVESLNCVYQEMVCTQSEELYSSSIEEYFKAA